jgi:hypothetical protein
MTRCPGVQFLIESSLNFDSRECVVALLDSLSEHFEIVLSMGWDTLVRKVLASGEVVCNFGRRFSMSGHLFPKLTLAVLSVAFAASASAQVAPAATGGGGLTLAAGVGVSLFSTDYGNGHIWGDTLWIDANPNAGPSFLQGFGVEVEARDLSWARESKYLPRGFRTDTLGGGPIYTFRHFHNVRPYVKGVISYGSLDICKDCYHFNWPVFAPGGGVEYRPFGRVWLRGDYEYQAWFDIFRKGYDLDPNGFTLGAVYDFGHPHFHH